MNNKEGRLVKHARGAERFVVHARTFRVTIFVVVDKQKYPLSRRRYAELRYVALRGVKFCSRE